MNRKVCVCVGWLFRVDTRGESLQKKQKNTEAGNLTPLHIHNGQKTSDWTNSSRAIRDLKSRYFKIIMLILFFIKNVKIVFYE
jgi:hypothetical protein